MPVEMITLPAYPRSGAGRFDFRVPDGLGNFVLPDWDDPDLRVEFFDSLGALRFTATVSSSPALVAGDDFDPVDCPEGGAFVAVEGLDLSAFALGAAEARVYARVDTVQVLPWPTAIACFEVIEDPAEGPYYTTTDKVRAEIPGSWPDEITDDMVLRAIADASRRIDACLSESYDVPFADINDLPPTPAVIEQVCRRLAAEQCLVWLGRSGSATSPAARAAEELAALMPADGRPPAMRLPGWRGPLGLYVGAIERGDLMA